jgi:probable F420-dependent oxidoreductase
VWASWRAGGTSLNYRGEFYTLRLMTPFFAAPPLDYPDPPIYISAVNEQMLKLAGSLCEGVHIHPFHSPQYLREVAWPHLRAGMHESGRSRIGFTAVAAVFAIPTDGAKAASAYERSVREQLAFYMSTPAYRAVVDLHGWAAPAQQLSEMARRGEWQAMGDLITDAMLDAFAVTGTWAALPGIIKQRYAGRLLDRVAYYLPYASPAKKMLAGRRRWRDSALWQITTPEKRPDGIACPHQRWLFDLHNAESGMICPTSSRYVPSPQSKKSNTSSSWSG